MATVDVASARAACAALRQLGGLEMLAWAAFDGQPVEAFVTTRGGGVSSGAYESLNMSLAVGDDPEAVLENRRRVAGALGADPADFVFCRQVHGAGVRVVTAADRGAGAFAVDDESVPEADVLVTADTGVVLAILAADCVPVVLCDPVAHVLACVHAGWRGTVARACAAAVDAMSALGASPDNVIAGIGPAIGADRYQVGPEVAAAAEAEFAAGGAVIRPDGTGRWLFDLAGANRLVLREAGVADGNMHVAPYVTGGGLFFSDRAARPCGRLALVARLGPRGER